MGRLQRISSYLWACRNSRGVRTGLVIFGLYWMLAFALPYDIFAEFINSIRIAIFGAGFIVYLPAALVAMPRRFMDGPDRMAVGITMLSLATIQIAVWSWAGRIFDFSTSLPESRVTGFVITMMLVAGVLNISAVGAERAAPYHLHQTSQRMIVLAFAVGFMAAGALFGAAAFLP